MEIDTFNETADVESSSIWPVGITETTTLTLALISLAINAFLIYILKGIKRNPGSKNSAYHVISHVSYFLITLLTTDIGFIIVSYVNHKKTILILYDAHNHLLLALYALMIMFSFNGLLASESWCRHCVKTLWVITSTMIMYSIALVLCGDELGYSFVILRVVAYFSLFVILAIRITAFLFKSCVRVETEMLQSVLILSFLCCWLPDFLFNVFNVNLFDLSVIYCIGVAACASNVIFNIILILIVDEDFRIRFKEITSDKKKCNIEEDSNKPSTFVI